MDQEAQRLRYLLLILILVHQYSTLNGNYNGNNIDYGHFNGYYLFSTMSNWYDNVL